MEQGGSVIRKSIIYTSRYAVLYSDPDAEKVELVELDAVDLPEAAIRHAVEENLWRHDEVVGKSSHPAPGRYSGLDQPPRTW